MIRPLRQRHRVMICTLGVLLPAAFAVGLAARRPIPAVTAVPAELAGLAGAFGQTLWTKSDLWTDQRIITTLHQEAAGSLAVEFATRDLVKPDVLVYWAMGPATVVAGLPANARLLGALSNRTPLPIPADARGQAGRFILYSLADHEVVAVSRSLVMERD